MNAPEDKEKRRRLNKKYYQKHKKELIAKAWKKQKESRRWLTNLKRNFVCKKCGENHPACLVFHHRNPNEKKFSIGTGRTRGINKVTILKEIAKCDILCANCHCKLHWEEKNASP